MGRLAAASIAVLASACSWGALDGFTGGSAEDAGPPDSGDGADGGAASEGGEGGTTLVRGASCEAIKASNPAAPDGRYLIEPPGNDPFEADCDMTQDGGGWMRVTEAMIAEEKKASVTVIHDSTDKTKLVIRVYANSTGCGEAPDSGYLALIRDVPKWTQIRARYEFYGRSSCWEILGAEDSDAPFKGNLIPFDPSIDVVRDAVKMGGSAGDAFAGDPERCDDLTTNFWQQPDFFGRRSLLAILRRGLPDLPAGLLTVASCTSVAAGVMSPTYWEYREIYVR